MSRHLVRAAAAFSGALVAVAFIGIAAGFAPDAKNNGVLPTGSIGTTEIADGAVTLAKVVDASGQNAFLCRKTASAGDWEDCTQAQATAALAAASTSAAGTVRLGVNGIPKCIRLSADSGPTGEADTTLPDLTFTPEANSAYVVTLQGAFDADAAGTGVYFYVLHGDASDGAVWGQTRNTSATSQSLLVGSQSSTFVQGASSGATLTPFLWTSMFETDADPTAVTVVYRAETGSGGTVTIQAGMTNLCYWRSVP